MDGTYRVPRKNAVTHAAQFDAGGIVTICGRQYPLDENFSRDERPVTCGMCKSKLPKPSPPAAIGGTWEGPAVYASRAALIRGGLLKEINLAIAGLSLFAELQTDGSLQILDYRRMPDQAAALAAVVCRTERQPALK